MNDNIIINNLALALRYTNGELPDGATIRCRSGKTHWRPATRVNLPYECEYELVLPKPTRTISINGSTISMASGDSIRCESVDGNWSMVLIREDGTTTVDLSGPRLWGEAEKCCVAMSNRTTIDGELLQRAIEEGKRLQEQNS